MNEDELTEALHDVMVRTTPPPPMDPAGALIRARRARKRRTAVVTTAAVAALVAGVGAAPAVLAHHNRSAGPMVAGLPSATGPVPTPKSSATVTSTATSTVTPTTAPTTRKSGDPWPEGQVDRTASAGPRADRAVALMRDVKASVPAGFSAPNLKYPDGRAMGWPQAQYASSDGEPDYWEYQALVPVQKGNRVGELVVQSTTPDGKPAVSPCKLAFWSERGACSIVDVGGKKVGVMTTNGKGSFDQVAAYRYPDGTVVIAAQSKKSGDETRPPLTQPIFTTDQLAALVTAPKFKISN
ncbi:hypothetical protein GCM10009630_21600 [Kribbella jejuensis]|uniref:Uncharacterized protein n=1 Tax=Kribbella jejuensis TaxID=236068 RepID=A0A542DSU0_9ACTN|nr:hypothetical protein [Kribbella jejuensis]TQJ06171.1 hypothetical protein FB475_5824 [Kribbella jejuensis]